MVKKNYLTIKLHLLHFLFNIRMHIGVIFASIALSNNYLKILKKIIQDLKNNGYSIIPNYYSLDEIQDLNNLIDNILDQSTNKESDNDFIERVEGQIKVKHNQNKYLKLRRYSTEVIFTFLSLFFYGRPKLPSVLTTVTHDGSFSHPAVPGKCNDPIAGEAHVDYYFHYLKAMILIEDITMENGPTAIMPGSCKNKKLFPTYVKLMNDKSTTVLDNKVYENLLKENPPKYLVGKKGDLILIDTCNIHWASKINKGLRKVIWFYF